MSIATLARASLATVTLLAASLFAGTTGCGEPAECKDLVAALRMAIETECDVDTRCGLQADPNAAPPRIRYTSDRHQQLSELLVDCDMPDLGEMPFFCGNTVPPCPQGYVCGDASFAPNVCLRR